MFEGTGLSDLEIIFRVMVPLLNMTWKFGRRKGILLPRQFLCDAHPKHQVRVLVVAIAVK